MYYVSELRIRSAGGVFNYYVLEYLTSDVSNCWGVVCRCMHREDAELEYAKIVMGTHKHFKLEV